MANQVPGFGWVLFNSILRNMVTPKLGKDHCPANPLYREELHESGEPGFFSLMNVAGEIGSIYPD